ncbi:uncharacterized protein J3R85_014587 [Psidium guajava]|nr:uncharacterized protein J3R85_014587 [Psidium guajava]
MASWLLGITITSAEDLKAHDVQLVASLSCDETNKKQRTDPSLGHTFEFTVEGAALLDARLEFKIEKKDSLGRKTDVVGEVHVPVKDLLVKGCAGHMKLKVLSREVRSSSSKTMADLEFSYKFGERFPVEAPLELEEETVRANRAAAAPPGPYTPPMPRPLMGYADGANPPSTPRPQTAYQHNWAAYPPPAPALPHQTAYMPNSTPTYFYGAPAGYGAGALPAPYLPPIPALHHQTAYVPSAIPTYFYGALAGYGPAASPTVHPGRDFLRRLTTGVAASTIIGAITNLGLGDFTDVLF